MKIKTGIMTVVMLLCVGTIAYAVDWCEERDDVHDEMVDTLDEADMAATADESELNNASDWEDSASEYLQNSWIDPDCAPRSTVYVYDAMQDGNDDQELGDTDSDDGDQDYMDGVILEILGDNAQNCYDGFSAYFMANVDYGRARDSWNDAASHYSDAAGHFQDAELQMTADCDELI